MPNAVTMLNVGIGNHLQVKPSSWLDFWSGIGSRERLITVGIVTFGAVAVINSTVWAIALSRMAGHKAPPDRRAAPETAIPTIP